MTLSEGTQTGKEGNTHQLPWEETSRIGKSVQTQSRALVAMAGTVEVMVTEHRECSKCHRIVPFKRVNFMLCEFHFKKIELWIIDDRYID